MTKVIIGAGISGLYTAIKLHRKGVRDIVVYDPRAGNYTRPGHLNHSVFRQAEAGIGVNFWNGDRTGHIKDLERFLYAEAKKLGITIENKRFVSLHEDPQKPGVVIADNEGHNEIVEADYVYDCTGAHRDVVDALNKMRPESPLQLTTITDLPVQNHFLAYVKISHKEWQQFENEKEMMDFLPGASNSLSYAQSIIKLRALGWNELQFPRCYGMEFGKDKVCVYLHAPKNLEKANYDKWVQTVLECYTSPISYQHLPVSSTPKPRFLAFTSNAQALEQVSYKSKNLPIVTALGDAQIDFDYALAHGILDGMKRIDALFEHMEIIDGKIYYFDSAEYMLTMNDLVKEHKNDVTNAAKRLKQIFNKALDSAQLKFRQAINRSTDEDEKNIMQDILKEIEARQGYIKARQSFSECHNKNNQVDLTVNHEKLVKKLNQIHTDLLKAYTGLPESFNTERADVQNLLTHLAVSWKETANSLFKNNKIVDAIDAYNKALELYNLNSFIGKHCLKELPIYSNLAIAYLGIKEYSEAIAAANAALSIYDRTPEDVRPTQLQEKIVFNLIKSLCAQAQELLAKNKDGDATSLRSQAINLMQIHKDKLTKKTLDSIEKIIADLQLRFPNSVEISEKIALVRQLSKDAEEEPAAQNEQPEPTTKDEHKSEQETSATPISDFLKSSGMFKAPDQGDDTKTKKTQVDPCILF